MSAQIAVRPQPTSVYVHVPFCDKKCTYCDFYSIEATQHIEAYVQTVIKEIDLRLKRLDFELIPDTIFFGGGTPTLLTAEQIERILNALPTPANDAEITMEANPGTVSPTSLANYRSLGINRLSFGVQSFNANELEFLTRIHSAQQAVDAVTAAHAAGFTNVNTDIMFALPNQSIESLTHSLECVVDLGPEHVSAYSLIYEPGTPLLRDLNRGLVKRIPDDVDANMYDLVTTFLSAQGYRQYEVSNFAKPGMECRHNLAYWHAKDHLSVGPSAHGLIQGTRYWNHRSLTSWQRLVESGTLPHANTETLSTKERLEEYIFLTLRADGLLPEHIEEQFGVNIRECLDSHLTMWIDSGFIVDAGNRLQLTSAGYAICDEITVSVLERLS